MNIKYNLLTGNDLSEKESFELFRMIMDRKLPKEEIKQILLLLKQKGESVDDIIGAVKCLRSKAKKLDYKIKNMIDMCGTGGDRSGTFNISTVASFIAASAGAYVAKHGNKSVSSRCGSADLLDSLGIKLDASPEKMVKAMEDGGIGYFHAPVYHLSFRNVQDIRKELKTRTIFNILGPLLNPLDVKRQLIGVFNEELADLYTKVLQKLKYKHVLVVHSEDGLDEATVSGKTFITELKDGKIKKYSVEPEEFGMKRATISKLKGGSVKRNKTIALNILKGADKGPRRDTAVLNAGLALYVSGNAVSIKEGIKKCGIALEAGKALESLRVLKKVSNQ